MIQLQQVSKQYERSTWAVRELDLHVETGELIVLLGESGCGKTTTLKMINRLIEPTAGRIELGGESIAETDPVALRRRIGYVFQGIGLFPHMTIGENIAVVPQLLGWSRNAMARRIAELLDLMHLPTDQYADRFPGELSGGQQQRVGVARALAAKPEVMLMDEPFGALDLLTRARLQEEYRRLHRQLELTTVMVTHDVYEALSLGDRVAVMREGNIRQIDTPTALMRHPADEAVAQLVSMPREQASRIEALMEGEA